MKDVLNWLNGKKTFLGLALYFVIGGLKQLGWMDEASGSQWVLLAEGIIGVGLLHKIKKGL